MMGRNEMRTRSTIGIHDDLFARWEAAGDRAAHDVLEPLGLSPRLTRLFAVAVCRDLWELLTDVRSRTAIEVAEDFADAKVTVKERRAAFQNARNAYVEMCQRELSDETMFVAFAARAASDAADAQGKLPRAISSAAAALGMTPDESQRRRVYARQGRLLAAIVGPGYELLPQWHTTDAVALARSCYETRDWSIMPYLADALQEAGCENEDVLDHCRGSGPHVRGDWVLDSLLGLT
jgi:hypothetical protein